MKVETITLSIMVLGAGLEDFLKDTNRLGQMLGELEGLYYRERNRTSIRAARDADPSVCEGCCLNFAQVVVSVVSHCLRFRPHEWGERLFEPPGRTCLLACSLQDADRLKGFSDSESLPACWWADEENDRRNMRRSKGS